MAAKTASSLPTAFRQGGSGFTVFSWQNTPIAFAQSIGFTSPQPVAAPVAIQPMDAVYPLQIMTPAAIGGGTLQLQMFEVYNSKIWDQIMNITDTSFPTSGGGIFPQYNDLAQVFLRLSSLTGVNSGQGVVATKLIYPPNVGIRGGTSTTANYADQYYGCVISDIRDDENIQISTMGVIKNLSVMYTYSKRVAANAANNTLV